MSTLKKNCFFQFCEADGERICVDCSSVCVHVVPACACVFHGCVYMSEKVQPAAVAAAGGSVTDLKMWYEAGREKGGGGNEGGGL